jgi:hypothetical protein
MRGAFQMLDGEKKLYSLRKPFIVSYYPGYSGFLYLSTIINITL